MISEEVVGKPRLKGTNHSDLKYSRSVLTGREVEK